MISIRYLEPGEEPPEAADDEPWIHVEATSQGTFYGTGAAWKPNGEWIGYVSLPEDVSLEKAIKAAQEWAEKYGIATIWVQREV